MNYGNWMYQTFDSPEELLAAIKNATKLSAHTHDHAYEENPVVPGTCMVCGAPPAFGPLYDCGHTARYHMKMMIYALQSTESWEAFDAFRNDLREVVSGRVRTVYFT